MGTYGAGIQLVVAAIDQRVDAIVPDLAWHSLLDAVAKDGAFRAGWWLSLCVYGEVLGVTGFPPGPAIQLASVGPAFRTMCLEGTALGTRHELVAVEVGDPREGALPDAGELVVVDPETGEVSSAFAGGALVLLGGLFGGVRWRARLP